MLRTFSSRALAALALIAIVAVPTSAPASAASVPRTSPRTVTQTFHGTIPTKTKSTGPGPSPLGAPGGDTFTCTNVVSTSVYATWNGTRQYDKITGVTTCLLDSDSSHFNLSSIRLNTWANNIDSHDVYVLTASCSACYTETRYNIQRVVADDHLGAAVDFTFTTTSDKPFTTGDAGCTILNSGLLMACAIGFVYIPHAVTQTDAPCDAIDSWYFARVSSTLMQSTQSFYMNTATPQRKIDAATYQVPLANLNTGGLVTILGSATNVPAAQGIGPTTNSGTLATSSGDDVDGQLLAVLYLDNGDSCEVTDRGYAQV